MAPLPRRELSPRAILPFAQRASGDFSPPRHIDSWRGRRPPPRSYTARSRGSDHAVTVGSRCGEAGASNGDRGHSACGVGTSPNRAKNTTATGVLLPRWPQEPHLRPLGLVRPLSPRYPPLRAREMPISQALLPLWRPPLPAPEPTPPPRPRRL